MPYGSFLLDDEKASSRKRRGNRVRHRSSDLGQFRIICAEDDHGGQIFRRPRVFSPDNPVCRIFCAYAASGKAYTALANVAGKHQRFVRLQNRSQMDLVE